MHPYHRVRQLGSLIGLSLFFTGCSLYQSEASKCLEGSGVELYRQISEGSAPSYCGLSGSAAAIPTGSTFASCWNLPQKKLKSAGQSEYSTILYEDRFIFQSSLATRQGSELTCLTEPMVHAPTQDFVSKNHHAFLAYYKDNAP